MGGNNRRSGRFLPGQSGNPDGRPPRKKRKKQEVSAFDVLEGRGVSVVMGGMPRELTLQEGLFHRTYLDALAGSRMAMRVVLKKILARETRRAPHVARFPQILMQCARPADVDQALIILGIATPSTAGERTDERAFLQLEPWAVTAALARSKIGRLSRKAVRDVHDRTRDPASVNWPEGSDDG